MSVFDEVGAEMSRQVAKWGIQNHPSVTQPFPYHLIGDEEIAKENCDSKMKQGIVSWLDIFLEEVAELAQASQYDDKTQMREELIQCIAVGTSWLESFDRNKH